MKGEYAVIELNSPVTPFMKETAFQRGFLTGLSLEKKKLLDELTAQPY